MLKFLGSNSGFGDKNNSAYIEKEDKFILIDCGFTVFNEIKNKFDFSKYSEINIIITHLHNDHAGSLSQMILYLWYIFGKKTVVVSKCEHIKTYLDITGTPCEAYELRNSMDNFEFIQTTHTKLLDAYGFRANFEDRQIVYTGDTEVLEPFIPYLQNESEFYVDVSKFGAVHLKIDEVKEKLQEIKSNGVKVYLMHIDDEEYIREIAGNDFYIV